MGSRLGGAAEKPHSAGDSRMAAKGATTFFNALGVQDRFGDVAVQHGLLSAQQLDEAIKVQKAAAKAGFRKRLGDILVRKGYLTPEQVSEVLKRQTVDPERRILGDFELLARLGEGSMGAVFKARQISMDRVVALKLLFPHLANNREFRELFVREARSVAKLNHPHIVAGYSVGTFGGIHYFCMEYVEEGSLGLRLFSKGGKLPEQEALEYARQVASALHHAHRHGLLHRDVKPENILLNRHGEAKLADLGLARIPMTPITREVGLSTDKGLAVGTPFYISPEQAQGFSNLTPASDLYSLGATLFHLLAGQPPYDAPTSREIMVKHVTDPVPDPRRLNPSLSAGCARICMALMQKNPRDRPKSGAVVAEQIADLLDVLKRPKQEAVPVAPLPRKAEPPTPAPASVPPVLARSSLRHARSRRRRSGVVVALAALLAAAAALVLVLVLLKDRISSLWNAPNFQPKGTKLLHNMGWKEDTEPPPPTASAPSLRTVVPAPAPPVPPPSSIPAPPSAPPPVAPSSGSGAQPATAPAVKPATPGAGTAPFVDLP